MLLQTHTISRRMQMKNKFSLFSLSLILFLSPSLHLYHFLSFTISHSLHAPTPFFSLSLSLSMLPLILSISLSLSLVTTGRILWLFSIPKPWLERSRLLKLDLFQPLPCYSCSMDGNELLNNSSATYLVTSIWAYYHYLNPRQRSYTSHLHDIIFICTNSSFLASFTWWCNLF